MVYISTKSRQDIVKKQKQIIEHVSKRHEAGDASDSANMKDCFSEFSKASRGLNYNSRKD